MAMESSKPQGFGYIKTTKTGSKYVELSFTKEVTGDQVLNSFINMYKSKSKKTKDSPDYIIFLKPKTKSAKGAQDAAPAVKKATSEAEDAPF